MADGPEDAARDPGSIPPRWGPAARRRWRSRPRSRRSGSTRDPGSRTRRRGPPTRRRRRRGRWSPGRARANVTAVRATAERSTGDLAADRRAERDDPAEDLVGAPGERSSRCRAPAASAGLPSRRAVDRRRPCRPRGRSPPSPRRRAPARPAPCGGRSRARPPPGRPRAARRRRGRPPRTRRRGAPGSRRRRGEAEARIRRALLAEPDRDLALGGLVGVRAVDEVERDLEAIVAADRARGGLQRVRRADQLARGGDRLVRPRAPRRRAGRR